MGRAARLYVKDVSRRPRRRLAKYHTLCPTNSPSGASRNAEITLSTPKGVGRNQACPPLPALSVTPINKQVPNTWSTLVSRWAPPLSVGYCPPKSVGTHNTSNHNNKSLNPFPDQYTNYYTVPLSPIQLDRPETKNCTAKTIQQLSPQTLQQWWPRCYTNQPYHGERTPTQSLVYPPLSATPKRILRAVEGKLKGILRALATVTMLRVLREAFPNIALCVAGGQTAYAVLAETQTGSLSRRTKVIIGTILLTTYFQQAQCATIGDLHNKSEHQAQLKLVDFFMTYQQRHHISGYDSEEEDKSTAHTYSEGVRGDTTLPTENHLIISIANASRSLATYTTWSTLLQMGTGKNTDIMIISEPGRAATEAAIKWGTHHVTPGETKTRLKRKRMGINNNNQMPYLVYAVSGLDGDGEGGVAILVHKKWRHRIKKIRRHKQGRWVQLTLQTAAGPVTVIGYYGRPDPQGKNRIKAIAEWQAVQQIAYKAHGKDHTVILAGDYNMSYNTDAHRHRVGNDWTQHTMLHQAHATAGLIDAYTHRHGKGATCRTWEQRREDATEPVWTSPDHIMISATESGRIGGVQIDDNTLSQGMDHSMVTAAVYIKDNRTVQKTRHTRIACNKEKAEELNQLIRDNIAAQTPSSKVDGFATLHKAITDAATSIKPPKLHKTKGAIRTKIQADIHTLGRIIRHLQRKEPIPSDARGPVYEGVEGKTIPQIKAHMRKLQACLNKKAEKRAQVRTRMYKYNRSEHFRKRDYGAFLNSALNRSSEFHGIEGFHTNTDTGKPSVSTDPISTKDMATNRIKNQHFTQYTPTPEYYTCRTQPAWDKLDTWFKELFHTTLSPSPDPRYAHIMDPVTLPELKHRIKCLRKKKAGGRSGVTADLLHLLDDVTLSQCLLPLINACLALEDIPGSLKLFAIWAIEKHIGAGAIITSAGKLNIRPIVLLEPSYKLIEAIIESRTSRALSDSSSLDPSQYGFTHNTGADDLLITTCMVYEDAHQHNKEIHTSNNDCTKAYDSIAHWVMETIYHYHRLPPKLIRFLINTDKHHRGHVLTAHGAGPEFEKDCGLGQGSVLAPLKWKLFLDPLLKQLRKIGTPYTMGTGADTVDIWATAFADDLTIIAPTHEAYIARMAFTNAYLSSHSHELQEILQSHTPADSIDPHLLNAIAQSLSIRTVLSPIASNYHITAKTPSCHAHHIDTPLLLSTLHYKHTLQHARARANTTLPTAYLVPKDHAQALLRAHPELVPIITVKKDQLAVWPSSFWEGGTGVMNLTYHEEVSLLVSPHFSHKQITKARTSVYARTQSTPLPSAELLSHSPPGTATETPLLLRFSLQDPPSNPTRNILTHGGIPTSITTDWTDIPSTLRPKVHRLLHRLLMTHHHSTWLARNKVAHPLDAVQPIITRRPPNPIPAPKEPSRNQKAKARKWKRDRASFMDREAMWHHGTPLRSSPKSWVRLCKLAKHSNKTIAKKRKRAAHLRVQQELDSRPPAQPSLTQWKHRTITHPTSTQSSPRVSVPEANEHTHTSHTSHTENTRKRHRTSNTDTIPITTREQEQGASGAPSPPARPNRKRPTPSQTATQGLVASGASSLTTGKRRRTQHRSSARISLTSSRPQQEPHTTTS